MDLHRYDNVTSLETRTNGFFRVTKAIPSTCSHFRSQVTFIDLKLYINMFHSAVYTNFEWLSAENVYSSQERIYTRSVEFIISCNSIDASGPLSHSTLEPYGIRESHLRLTRWWKHNHAFCFRVSAMTSYLEFDSVFCVIESHAMISI